MTFLRTKKTDTRPYGFFFHSGTRSLVLLGIFLAQKLVQELSAVSGVQEPTTGLNVLQDAFSPRRRGHFCYFRSLSWFLQYDGNAHQELVQEPAQETSPEDINGPAQNVYKISHFSKKSFCCRMF